MHSRELWHVSFCMRGACSSCAVSDGTSPRTSSSSPRVSKVTAANGTWEPTTLAASATSRSSSRRCNVGRRLSQLFPATVASLLHAAENASCQARRLQQKQLSILQQQLQYALSTGVRARMPLAMLISPIECARIQGKFYVAL